MFQGPIKMPPKPLFMVRVCTNRRMGVDDVPSCGRRGSIEIADRLEQELRRRNLPVGVVRSPCMNGCAEGPNARIQGGLWMNHVTPERIAELVEEIEAELARRAAAVAS